MAAACFISVWLLWPVIAIAGGLGFAPLAAIVALLLGAGAIRRFGPQPYMAAMIAFFAYVALTMLWSPAKLDPGRAGFLKIFLLLLAQGVMIDAMRALPEVLRTRIAVYAKWALLAQVALVGLLALFEKQAIQFFYPGRPDDEGVQNLSRNSLIMATAAPALIVLLLGRPHSPVARPFAIGVLLVEFAVLLLRDVEAGPLALVAAGICAGLMRLRPRDGFRILAVGFAVLILAAPVAFGILSHGADARLAATSSGWRLAIWARAIEEIHKHPIFGGGFGSLRVIRDYIEVGVFKDQLYMPNHPHNMALQLWAETGCVGVLLFSALLVTAAWRLPQPRWLGPGAVALGGVIGAAASIAFVSFDFWNEGWWAAVGFLVLLCVAAIRAPEPQEDVVDANDNNFSLLRLVFALGVAAYHLALLSGAPSLTHFVPMLSVAAQICVQGFFVLSGYLVYGSLESSKSFGDYVGKRVRRLYPAYAFVILACVAGALLWSARSRENLGEVIQYLGANLVFLNFLKPDLPGLFVANPLTEVNGALWTLKIEVMFYLLLPALAWALRLASKRRRAILALIYAAAEAWRIFFSGMPHTGRPGLLDLEHQLPGQMSFFAVGMAFWLLRDRIVWRWWIVVGGVLALAASFMSPWLTPLRALGLGVTSMWIAVGVPRLFDAARFGDLSYGIYLIHFPIVQGVVRAGIFGESPGQGVGVSLMIIVLTALLLWRFVEKPALRADSAYRRSSMDGAGGPAARAIDA